MKKIFSVILAVVIMVLVASVVQAKTERQMADEILGDKSLSYVAPAPSDDSVITTLSKKISSFKANINKKLFGDKKNKGEFAKLKEQADENTNKINKNIDQKSDALGKQAEDNAWLICLFIVALAIFIYILYRRNKKHTISQIDSLAGRLISTDKSVEILGAIKEIPAETVKCIKTLDPAPFEFEAAGHQVVYQSPLEGINEGYYLKLHVPENMAGDPATYDRPHEINWGVAKRECRKTMRLYFEGKFNAPEYKLQKELIEYLVKTGEISYRKIS
jgi:preprotein translocase subunit YajC